MLEAGNGAAPILLSHGRFRDFEHLAEATRGWNLDFRQLDRGTLDGELLQVGVGPVVVMRMSLSLRFDQRGGVPPGVRTFGLPEANVVADWCGQQVSDTDINVFSRGAEFEAVSVPGFMVHTVSVSEELLDDVAQTLGLSSVSPLVEGPAHALRCDEDAVRECRAALRRVCEVASGGPEMLQSAGLQDELQFEIPAQLLTALAASRGPLDPPSFGARALALQRAVPFIEQHRERPLTVQEVCRAAGVSRRTLHYAIRERFGVTPKAYLTAMRLDGVRRDLVPSESPVKVADVANRWGFWHMGQFAADYRRQFGELPSETLRRRGGA